MFNPVIPGSGLVAWRFLQRTYDSQFEAFTNSTQLTRNTEYFSENISKISNAEDLVADRRMLEVALGAFGLQDDINNKYFIQKILDEGTTNDDSLANRFSDERYQDFSKAFGFGPGEVSEVATDDFAVGIIAKFQANSFEIAAGEQNDTMRVALYAERELSDLASSDASDDTKWFTIMGQPPLRALFEKALNLPASFGQIDIDQQLTIFKQRATSVFGSSDVSQFSEPEAIQDLVTKYVVRSQLEAFNTSTSSASIALALLQS
jgi:hypothetical protein